MFHTVPAYEAYVVDAYLPAPSRIFVCLAGSKLIPALLTMGLCSSSSCITQASHGALGSTTAVFCPKHADDGMVNVQNQRCLDAACLTCPSFNAKGNKTATYCEQHAQHGMVNVRNKLCSRALCTYEPFAKVARCKTEAHCKRRAEDEDVIVDVRRIDCSHSTCRKRPSYNYKGRKTTA